MEARTPLVLAICALVTWSLFADGVRPGAGDAVFAPEAEIPVEEPEAEAPQDEPAEEEPAEEEPAEEEPEPKRGIEDTELRALHRDDVPSVVDLESGKPLVPYFIEDLRAAEELGKALFWDSQVGSDGQACASCHAHAGADNRIVNQLSPGLNGGNAQFDPTATGGGGANYTLKSGDFPFHKLSDPSDRHSDIQFDSDDVASSQGVFPTLFSSLNGGLASENCADDAPGEFAVRGVAVRRVEPRNTPTVINAVFNFRNFWDGRANNIFNGVDPFGLRNREAKVLFVKSSGRIDKEDIALTNSSLASQAVGPPLSDFEMSCGGKAFATLGKKILRLQPLATQRVLSDDSLLGDYATPSGYGLDTSYADMIRAAFPAKFWDSDALVDADKNVIGNGDPTDDYQFTVMETNFSFFWGLALQAYQSTLISTNSAFDRFARGESDALSDKQKKGLDIFINKGKCVNCHDTALFTKASTLHLIDEDEEGGLVERMLMNDEKQTYSVFGRALLGQRRRSANWEIQVDVQGSPSRLGERVDNEKVNGKLRIRHGGSDTHEYEATSFVLDADGDERTQDVEFTARLVSSNSSFSESPEEKLRGGRSPEPKVPNRPPSFPAHIRVILVDDDEPSKSGPWYAGNSDDTVTIFDSYSGDVLIDVEVAIGDLRVLEPALYDNGFYNIGVRPTNEDLGVGGEDPFENPLSHTRQYLQILRRQNVRDPFEVDPCKFEVPFDPSLDVFFFPGGFGESIECDSDHDGVIDFETAEPAHNRANRQSIRQARVAVDGAFKTSGLRNIALSGPYFHNGGQETLAQVVEFYNRGGDFNNHPNKDPDITSLGLSDDEKEALVAFLESLTDWAVANEEAPFDHPSLVLFNGHRDDENYVHPDPNRPARGTDRTIDVPAIGRRGRIAAGYAPLAPFKARD